MRIVGIVLSGGMSRRFGKPKAFALYKGKTFYERACEVLEPLVEEVVIVARPEFGSFRERRILYDDIAFRGKGPLAGIYSVMKEVEADWYIVLACDMPLMNESTIQRLLQKTREVDADAIVPYVKERLQPLAAAYHQRTFPMLESVLKEDKLKVNEFLRAVHVHQITDLPSKPFQNVNTIEDLRTIEEERI